MTDDDFVRLPAVSIDRQTNYRLRRHLLEAGGTISEFIRKAIKEKLSQIRGASYEKRPKNTV